MSELLDRIKAGDYGEVIILDGLDDAIIGIATSAMDTSRLVYSRSGLVDIFVSQGMSWEEAEEWVSFNIDCAYMGQNSPVIVDDM